jgi:hypothetical protein
MGLDIYAGPLCRYYAGEWKTVVQQWGETQSVPVAVETSNEPGAFTRLVRGAFSRLWRRRGPVDPVAAIVAWRSRLALETGLQDVRGWDWPESLDLPYETDKPDWDGYGAVQLWAAYTAQTGAKRPESFNSDWAEDEVLVRVRDAAQRFSHIVGPELWLPLETGGAFDGTQPNGSDDVRIGSVFTLLEELKELNRNSWRAADEEIRAWRQGDAQPERLESIARWGFSIWFCLTEFAVANRLPMRLDY